MFVSYSMRNYNEDEKDSEITREHKRFEKF